MFIHWCVEEVEKYTLRVGVNRYSGLVCDSKVHTSHAPTRAGHFHSVLQDGINVSHGKYACSSQIVLIRF